MTKQVLLVEPDFPYPKKSKHRASVVHKNFVPVGLLKIGAYYKSLRCEVKLVRGNVDRDTLMTFRPGLILVTSLFTYWSRHVWTTLIHYRNLFPRSEIILGGIYATLHHDKTYFKAMLDRYNISCHIGLHSEAEKHYPDYSLLETPVDHHVTHATRGCIRRCSFCGTWKIEPDRHDKSPGDLIEELKSIGKNKVVFFDNNFLANEHIHEILEKLIELKINGKPISYECQSGFDGRLLEDTPELATFLNRAHFQNVKIAWDNSVAEHEAIKKQLDILERAGYKAKNMSVFMIYNFNISYEDMLKKLAFCQAWGVQIADCRFRPLDAVDDNYNPRKAPESQDTINYFLHPGWNDALIRDFRRKVREHNIWVRYAREKGRAYNARMERWGKFKRVFRYFNLKEQPRLDDLEIVSPWKSRFEAMNKIRIYFTKNDIAAPDFNNLTVREIDRELSRLMSIIGLTFQEDSHTPG